MEANEVTVKHVQLIMTEKEATWLWQLVQNPSRVDETQSEKIMREKLWHQLANVVGKGV